MVEKWEEERRQSEDDYIAKTCENLIRENIKSDDEEYIKSQINECIDKVSEPIKKLKDKYEIVKFCKNETDFITEIDKKKEFEDKCIIEVTEELKKREVLRDKVNLFIEDYIKAKKICDSKVSNKTNLSNQKKEYEFCIKETKKLSLQEVQVGILTSTNPLSKKIKLEKRKKIAQVFLSNKEPFTLTEIRKKTKLRSPEVKAILLYMHRAGAISKKEGKYQLTDKDKLTHIITGRPVYEKSDEKLLRRQSELIINLFKEEDKGFTTEELINKTCLTFKEVDRIIRTLRQYSLLISRIDKSKGEKYIFQKKIHQPRHFLIKGDEANKIIDRLIKGESISREDIREVKEINDIEGAKEILQLYINRKEPLTKSDLATFLNYYSGTVQRYIDFLIKNGIVYSRTEPETSIQKFHQIRGGKNDEIINKIFEGKPISEKDIIEVNEYNDKKRKKRIVEVLSINREGLVIADLVKKIGYSEYLLKNAIKGLKPYGIISESKAISKVMGRITPTYSIITRSPVRKKIINKILNDIPLIPEDIKELKKENLEEKKRRIKYFYDDIGIPYISDEQVKKILSKKGEINYSVVKGNIAENILLPSLTNFLQKKFNFIIPYDTEINGNVECVFGNTKDPWSYALDITTAHDWSDIAKKIYQKEYHKKIKKQLLIVIVANLNQKDRNHLMKMKPDNTEIIYWNEVEAKINSLFPSKSQIERFKLNKDQSEILDFISTHKREHGSENLVKRVIESPWGLGLLLSRKKPQ